VLFVERPDLIPVINYPTVFSPREMPTLVIDAKDSYDPQAASAGTTTIPIVCTITCPASFADSCNSGLT
jgi:hypothetical protein